MNRAELARAITLAESTRPEHRAQARQLCDAGQLKVKALRIGITGPPGAGKSTLIENLGQLILEDPDQSLAVLTVDPSSHLSRGSLLGDKTRMPVLGTHPRAFVRTTPSSGTLGGIAAATEESINLCQAAGYRTILIETVGVGQSEIALHTLVDIFILVLPPNSGDELQAAKRGIVEVADLIAVNKADGPNVHSAEWTAAQYRQSVSQPVITCSALTGANVSAIWEFSQKNSGPG